MKFLLSLILSLFLSMSVLAQSKTLTASNGQQITIDGTDGFRGNDELWMYSVTYYSRKPTNESGVDVYVIDGRIWEIRDRAGVVFLQGRQDPGPISVGINGYVLSAHGAARRWVMANLVKGQAVSLDGKVPVTSVSPYLYPGSGMIQAENGKATYFRGKNVPRSQDFIVLLTPDYYKNTPPNDAGIDVLIVKNRVTQINDRASAVYLTKTKDPGPIKIDDEINSLIVSGNGEGRKWILENLSIGNAVSINTGDGKEVTPLVRTSCFDGAHYRKVVTSFDSWTGIAGFVKIGTPKVDEARLDEKDRLPIDNFSIYLGGNAGGKFEVDAGLTWEFTVDNNGKKSDRRNAFRPFWRTQKAGDWNSAPAKEEFYFYPGETVQLAVLVAGPGRLKLIVTDNKTKMFQTEFDAEGFVAGAPRQFKRVNAIDQRSNEGRPTQATKAEIRGTEWLQTVLLRGEGATTQQLPFGTSRGTEMNCGGGLISVTPVDPSKGGERIDIIGTPKN